MQEQLISKEEAIERVVKALDFVGSRDIDCAVQAIEDTPQVPYIPRVESHWIKLTDGSGRDMYSDEYRCANCGCSVHLGCAYTDCDYDFCPICAAVMCGETTLDDGGDQND